MTIKIAICGVGRWGVNLLRNFRSLSGAEVVAVADSNPERLAYCQERFQLDSDLIIITQNWQEVNNIAGLEAVVIATPASTHYDLIVDALKKGYHVLAEKPLTLDPDRCIELTRLAKKKQKQLLIDRTYLFNPAVIKGQEILKAKELGKLRYGYASRTNLGPVRYDVDVLWDLAIHDLSIFNCWLGETPIEVSAKGNIWLQPEVKNPPLFTAGLWDLVWVRLEYPSGFLANIHFSWINPDKQRRLCVVGNKGTLIFDEMDRESPLTIQRGYFQIEDNKYVPQGIAKEIIEVASEEPLKKVCDRFIQNINNNATSSISSGWGSARLVQTLTCLSLSLQQQGKTIRVPQISLSEE